MSDKPFRVGRLLRLFLLLALLALPAWSVGRKGKNAELSATERERRAVQIAADFAQDGDIAKAKSQLESLGVPKPQQWVAALAERYIAEKGDTPDTHHLVELSVALGLKTVAITRYARAHAASTLVDSTSTQPPRDPSGRMTPLPPTSPTLEPTLSPTPTATSTPTPTPTMAPVAIVQADVLNVRSGPSTYYPVVGRLTAGKVVSITGQSEGGTWWRVDNGKEEDGWIYGKLAEAQGALADVPVITDVPPPPPTPTPRPPTPTPVPRPQAEFRVVSTRLLSIQENGGCLGMHNIFVKVIDASGAPLNGIRVGRVWVPEDVKITGADNKGPGRAVFDLFKHGDQVHVLGFSSETTRPLEVEDEKIPIPELIGAGYCPNEAECHRLISQNHLCRFHYSWEVVFQRTR
ncbi:MAG: SH3 domain-containing protein [Anaerolineae bacterium]|nr:SH3 domain-containing protein [Anaerolineae bacterium]